MALAQPAAPPPASEDVQANIDRMKQQADDGYRKAHELERKIEDAHGELEAWSRKVQSMLPQYYEAQRQAAAHRAANPPPQ